MPFWELAGNLEALEIRSNDSDRSIWTIEAAARGGDLRRLVAPFIASQVFEIPELLPHWLQIERWGQNPELKVWASAARWLRQFLAHASRRQDWLRGTSLSNLSAVDRTLTLQDLRKIKARVDGGCKLETFNNGKSYACVLKCYLPWLVERREVAEQVLDAWNAIVVRGEADLISCPCFKCQECIRHDTYFWEP